MSNLSSPRVLRLTIRLLLGVFFIGTAVLKLLSIDSFEVYIYSFGIVNFITTTFLSRLLIFIELLIGISLVLNICHRQIWWLTMLMMAGFILFLVYAAIFRNDSNCHCFGNLVELNPLQSIVKNIIVIALLIMIKDEQKQALTGYLVEQTQRGMDIRNPQISTKELKGLGLSDHYIYEVLPGGIIKRIEKRK